MTNRFAWMAAGIVGFVGLVGSPAAAGGWSGGWSDGGWTVSIGHGSTSACSASYASAGVLWIDGCATTIRGGSPQWEIVRAFRRAGYHASIERGAVVVRFGRRAPVVHWQRDGQDARFSWAHGCLTVRTVKSPCGSCASCRPRVRPGFKPGGWFDGGTSCGTGRERDRRPFCPPPRRGRGHR